MAHTPTETLAVQRTALLRELQRTQRPSGEVSPLSPEIAALDEQIAVIVGWTEHRRLIEWAESLNPLGTVDTALSFTPMFHTEVRPRQWVRAVNPLAPFGARPSMDLERQAFQESRRIEAEGQSIIVFDHKH